MGVAATDATPRPLDRADREPTFFDKRVDAVLSLITGQGTPAYDRAMHGRASDLYHTLENDSQSYAETWLLALKTVLIERGVLSEAEISRKLAAIQRILEPT